MPTKETLIAHPPTTCGGCGDEIEGCHGARGDWMHSASRREACLAGGLARPATVAELGRRRAS